ncbi:MAG: YihY/virulence factor BrkB family protein [Bacteroidota bacterium]
MISRIFNIIKQAGQKFKEDEPIQLAATLSFLTIFAVPPILIIITSMLGFWFGDDVTTGKLYQNLHELINPKVARQITDILSNFKTDTFFSGQTFSLFFMLIIASSTFFAIIQNSLNKIWRVKPKPRNNILKIITDRLTSFGIIFILGIIFLLSLFLDAMVAILKDYMNTTLPQLTYYTLKTVKFLFSFLATTITFAFLFKFLPDVKIRWRVTWTGAFITAILFTIGKGIITYLIGQFGIASMYGAVGSFVVFLVWVFYSALIFYLGAEITEQYADFSSRNIVPKKHAVRFEIKEINHPTKNNRKDFSKTS